MTYLVSTLEFHSIGLKKQLLITILEQDLVNPWRG